MAARRACIGGIPLELLQQAEQVRAHALWRLENELDAGSRKKKGFQKGCKVSLVAGIIL
jgi:hypothetical protein